MPRVKIFSTKSQANTNLEINSPRKLVINENAYCIVRTQQGIYVVDEGCPHRRASLSEGTINTYNQIICPLHEYRFDLVTGQEDQQRCNFLNTYPVEITEDGVFLII